MPISLTSRVAIPADVMIQELQGEAVLLNISTGKYFGLDEIGTRMWVLMTTFPSIEAACAELRKEYDVQADQLRQDMLDLVAKLVDNGLLQVQGE